MTAGAVRHVLVVDDADLRESLRDILEEAGRVVSEAADGAPALRRMGGRGSWWCYWTCSCPTRTGRRCRGRLLPRADIDSASGVA